MMANRRWQDKIDVVMAIHEVIMYHWHKDNRCIIPYDDPQAWDHIIHSRTEQDWWDIVDVAEILFQQYPEYTWSYKYLKDDVAEIKKRLMFGRDVSRSKDKATRSYNTTAWRCLMAFKDYINDIDDRPTQRLTDEQRQQQLDMAAPTGYERLFQ